MRVVTMVLAMLVAVLPAAPARADARVVAVHVDVDYDPVLPVQGCRYPSYVSGRGTLVEADRTAPVKQFWFSAEQRICANLHADDYCGYVFGDVSGTFCLGRTLTFATVAGQLTLGGHAHQVLIGLLVWTPHSVPTAQATLTGTLVLQ